MRDAEPRAIRLQDYTVPDFLIESTQLHFDLEPTATIVTSTLKFRRNKDSKHQKAPLVLHGQEIELQSVTINGEVVSADQYQVDDEQLTIADVPDEFEFVCVGKINPQENTSLEGLYKSQSMFCTQCEAEGFRKITYYLDRPDVLSEFTTTLIGDKSLYPVLLSNGNLVKSGDLGNGRHFATWHDPFKKPAYLFALVAGNLSVLEDSFTTCSGREVALKIFVEPKDLDKCDHAMTSLKNSMKWDEEVYGREYDLDIFMIVAVDDFNMGAMENKGLNIFNTSCVLAKPETTTDAGFQRVEAVVAHEYFHNWSGNRVTCRDWFQLSLKEGFTVFRDSEFSADMGSRTVKRVEDSNVLRTMQFAEDSGPMSHPVQPASFIEISNFYTLTVYEKGAEVVRMIHTLLGPELFRKGSDIYFEKNDGKAATIEDFVGAMAEASGRDFSQFMNWYHQAGTPILSAEDKYDADTQTYQLIFTQTGVDTPESKAIDKKPYLIPVRIGLLGGDGPITLNSSDYDVSGVTSAVFEITETTQTITFNNVSEKPVPSLLQGFSAPVKLKYPYSRQQLINIMSLDEDGFNRWDASQQLCVQVISEIMEQPQDAEITVDPQLIEAFKSLLLDDTLDPAMVAHMLTLPSESYLAELNAKIDVDAIHFARKYLRNALAQELKAEFEQKYAKTPATKQYQANAEQIALRAIKNVCLSYLVTSGEDAWADEAYAVFQRANNMTDQFGALSILVHSQTHYGQSLAQQALASFYEQWQNEALVVNQWFGVQASVCNDATLDNVKALMQHPAFTIKNPNKVRALIGAFANGNPVCFHDKSGAGYEFLADRVIELNELNPQIAARLLTPLTRWKKQTDDRQELMQAQLKRIVETPNLSKDVFEVVSKSLVK
ncbi:aminopeptidase N [Sessilibacter sp. MAH1]